MRKLWTIAWKEISTRFTDRNLLLIMIAAPLAIATIVGLAFGGLGGSESPVEHIRVAVVNLDAGGGQSQRFGDILTSLLVSGELPASEGATLTQCPGEEQPTNASQAGGTSLDTLIDGTAFGTAEAVALIVAGTIDSPSAYPGSPEFLEQAARSAVDHGQYAALVIIPRTFSASLAALMDPTRDQPQVEVAVYGNRGEALASGIVGSVVDGLTAQMTSGSIAIGAMIGEVMSWRPEALARLPQAGLDELYACAFLPGSDVVSLDRQTIEPAGENNAAGGILVAAGSAQAMFFALFTGQFGILSMHEERKNWTLQRLVASPTPAWSILGGKLVGVMASILFQLTALAAALTLVGSLMSGRLAMIWGSHLGLLAATLLAVSIAVGGLGMLLAGILKTVEQASIVASVVNMALAVLGGAFGFSLPSSISSLSMIYWGRQAFLRLAAGQTDIGLHLTVLSIQGFVMFAVGLWLFSRRFEL